MSKEVTTNKKSEREIQEDKLSRIMAGVDAWCSFYRENVHRFCLDYLGIKLKKFQQILIVMMNLNNYFMYIASRG